MKLHFQYEKKKPKIKKTQQHLSSSSLAGNQDRILKWVSTLSNKANSAESRSYVA